MSKTNVAVTGASGFIGSHLVKRLASDDRVGKVYAVTGHVSPADESSKIRRIYVKLAQLAGIKFDDQVDVLVHLVGQWRTDNTAELTRVNVDSTRDALSVCQRNNIGRIIFLSTANVLLRNPGKYAKSKFEAEQVVRSSGLSYCIVRSTPVYGQGDSGFSRLAQLIELGIPVPVFGDGSALEQPIYIDELTELLATLAIENERDLVIAAGGLQALTYRELLGELAGGLRKKVRVVHLPARLFMAAAALLAALYLPSPLTVEQIDHITEDLVVEDEWRSRFPQVTLQSVSENLQYLHPSQKRSG